MAKRQLPNEINDEKYVPMQFVQNSLLEENPVVKKVIDFIRKNKPKGALTWEQIDSIDKELADEFRAYIENNKQRLERKYSQFGADLEKAAVKRQLRVSKSKTDIKATKKATLTVKPKTKKERVQEVKELLTKDVNTLGIKEIKSIITYSTIGYERLKPYWERRTELMNKKTDYNKPKPIQAAKALLTFNFSGKSNPSKWIEFEPIIKAKLYCAKMGIDYLTKEAPDELPAILKQIKPNLDKVLKSLNYKNINEVKF